MIQLPVTGKVRVCLITFPLGEAGRTPLMNLITLLSAISHEVFVISGGSAKSLRSPKNVHIIEIFHKISSNTFSRIVNYIRTELMFLCKLTSIFRKVDLFIFFIGGESLVLPLLVIKLLNKKEILTPGGLAIRVYSVKKDPLTKILSLMVKFNLCITSKIILYSPRLLIEGNLRKYQHKTLFAHEHFVDFNKFRITKPLRERALVGYVGRLSEEKGILNLIEAIPLVLKEKESNFLLCGKGDLAETIESFIKKSGVERYVKMIDWVDHTELPPYLNQIKLLVLPSYTEGLPNILLEAMACGTPVLATPVGAIPDIIKDGETGFILESNNPKHIANKIIELLSKPEILEKVSKNAYKYVRENFNYEKTLRIWRKIINELTDQNVKKSATSKMNNSWDGSLSRFRKLSN